MIESGETKRIGNNTSMDADVRFVFASNVSNPTAGLIPDLYARLHVVRIPSLRERAADIPSIFIAVLNKVFKAQGLDPTVVANHLKGDHMESLCLDAFETENVQGLVDIADRIAANIADRVPLSQAVDEVFTERFKDGPVARRQEHESKPVSRRGHASIYEKNKQLIVTTYHHCEGNISAVARTLNEQGISCSRRWLTHYAKAWGLRR